jgi:hypothetical protein
MFAWRSAAVTIGSSSALSPIILQTGITDPERRSGESRSPAIAGGYDA